MLNIKFNKILLIIVYGIFLSTANCYADDLYYKNIIFDQQLIHTVTVNPKKYKIINCSAMGAVNQNTSSLINIAHHKKALVAINGGFFREIYHNLFVPAGILKIDNVWHGVAYQARAAIGWNKYGEVVLVDRLASKTRVQFGDLKLPVSYFNPIYSGYNNKYINPKKSVIYSSIYPNFNNFSINYPNIIINQNNEVAYIYKATELINNNIIDDTVIKLASLNVIVSPQLNPNTSELWQKVDFITGGAPVLIKDYQAVNNYNQEKLSYNFVHGNHLRTAVCVLADGNWRFIATSFGMDILTLVNVAQNLQCKDAINLDGGSSSSLYVAPGVRGALDFVPNQTAITDAILVLSR